MRCQLYAKMTWSGKQMQLVAVERTYSGKSGHVEATPNLVLTTCYDERLNEQKRLEKDVNTDRQSRLMAVHITSFVQRLLTLEDQQSKSFQHIISSAKLSSRHRITYLSLEIKTSIIHWSFQLSLRLELKCEEPAHRSRTTADSFRRKFFDHLAAYTIFCVTSPMGKRWATCLERPITKLAPGLDCFFSSKVGRRTHHIKSINSSTRFSNLKNIQINQTCSNF